MDNPVFLHIPHSSTFIPEENLSEYLISKEKLAEQNLKLADLYTDELYEFSGGSRAVFPVSRFFVDAERFGDDAQELMAERGMGALYTVTTDLEPMRNNFSASRRAQLMDRYYWPHHRFLDQRTGELLKQHGKCLFVDCHSYPSKALPYELENRKLARPQIGIGTDSFHTPQELVRTVVEEFESLGYEVGLNVPFSGTLVPSAYYQKNKNVMSFMIEIRKDLYMDESTGEKLRDFAKVKKDVGRVLGCASDWLKAQKV